MTDHARVYFEWSFPSAKRDKDLHLHLVVVYSTNTAVVEAVQSCNHSSFTVDQLRALKKFLPEKEEIRLLKGEKYGRTEEKVSLQALYTR